MPRIAQESIDQVLDATDIVEVIGSYLKLQRAGSSFRGLCPFHQEKTPSFNVSPAKQAFHCFGCGAGGGVLQFVMDYEQVDFLMAVRRLADRAGIHLMEDAASANDKPDMRRRLLDLHEKTTNWLHHFLLRTSEGAVARDYLKSRGFTKDIAKSWKLGFAPDSYTAFTKQAREWGFKDDEILASGLAAPREGDRSLYDRFRGRMMIPICNDYGEVIAFSGRSLQAEVKTAKYVNSPETAIFHKGKTLFGLHRTKRSIINAGEVIVCEGQLDLITAVEQGLENIVASQGTAFTPRQATLLKRFADKVILCFDSDAAGKKAVRRSLPALLGVNLDIRVMGLPGGQDPDSFIRSEGADTFRQHAENSLEIIDFLLRDAINLPPAETAQKVDEISSVLALISDSLIRGKQINKVAAHLSINPQDLHGAVRKAFKNSSKDVYSQDLDEEKTKSEKPLTLNPTAEFFCKMAISCPKVKAYLRDLKDPSLSDLGGDFLIVHKIVSADFTPERQAFWLATQTAELQSYIARLDLRHIPQNPLAKTKDYWKGVLNNYKRNRLAGLTARLRTPGLSAEEIIRIQKKILDIQGDSTSLSGSSD
ncbi:MAG: DNA primase [Chthoniobacterales bacterium]